MVGKNGWFILGEVIFSEKYVNSAAMIKSALKFLNPHPKKNKRNFVSVQEPDETTPTSFLDQRSGLTTSFFSHHIELETYNTEEMHLRIPLV